MAPAQAAVRMRARSSIGGCPPCKLCSRRSQFTAAGDGLRSDRRATGNLRVGWRLPAHWQGHRAADVCSSRIPNDFDSAQARGCGALVAQPSWVSGSGHFERRTAMSELIVVGFKQDMYRASEVLNSLGNMNNSWVDLNDAVAVYRDYDGKLRVDQSYQLTSKEGAGWGAILGGLIGAMIAAPFTAGASVAAVMTAGTLSGVALGATAGAIDAGTWKEDYGISEEFVRRVSTLVQPGDSAIFALLRVLDPDLVAAQFKGYGGIILRTSLNEDQKAKVEATLHAR